MDESSKLCNGEDKIDLTNRLVFIFFQLPYSMQYKPPVLCTIKNIEKPTGGLYIARNSTEIKLVFLF